MKRVGIITFHRAINNGALLQAFALHKFFKKNNVASQVIDYRCNFIEKSYRLAWNLKKNRLSSWINWFSLLIPNIQRKAKFRRFLKQHVECSSQSYTKSNIHLVNDQYDVFICGSDQVWNLPICGNDTAYMLDFVEQPEKKYSYAVSTGDFFPPKQDQEHYKKLINDMQKVSVREKSSQKYLTKMLHRDVVTHLDPTLLLRKEDWLALIPLKPIHKRPYIFVYTVHPERNIMKYACTLSEKTGYDVICLYNRARKVKNKEKKIHIINNASPEDFLSYIYHAEYVISNSFHGTVFSIIYQKRFLSELVSIAGFNNRIWELLSLLHLKDRVLEWHMELNRPDIMDVPMDWKQIEACVGSIGEDSSSYLQGLAIS